MRRTLRGFGLLVAGFIGTVGLAQDSRGPVVVSDTRVPAPACPWLQRADNCWAQALSEFEQCAPPQEVRGTLYVDGLCRYYDGTFLRSEVLVEPSTEASRDPRTYELKFELLKVGKPCFSFRRKLVPSGAEVSDGPREIETEIVTRHGTVRYVQSWEADRQIALWEEYQRARHPPGTEVLPVKSMPCDPETMVCLKSNKPPDKRPRPLDTYAAGEKSVGFLTCPDRSMVLIGIIEALECDTALPVRRIRAVPDAHALEFAFVQPLWTKKSIACGLPKPTARVPTYFEQQVIFHAPEPTFPPREAGPVPDRLRLDLPPPRATGEPPRPQTGGPSAPPGEDSGFPLQFAVREQVALESSSAPVLTFHLERVRLGGARGLERDLVLEGYCEEQGRRRRCPRHVKWLHLSDEEGHPATRTSTFESNIETAPDFDFTASVRASSRRFLITVGDPRSPDRRWTLDAEARRLDTAR